MEDMILIARGYIFEKILPTTLNNNESLNEESKNLNSDEIYQLFSSRDYDYE